MPWLIRHHYRILKHPQELQGVRVLLAASHVMCPAPQLQPEVWNVLSHTCSCWPVLNFSSKPSEHDAGTAVSHPGSQTQFVNCSQHIKIACMHKWEFLMDESEYGRLNAWISPSAALSSGPWISATSPSPLQINYLKCLCTYTVKPLDRKSGKLVTTWFGFLDTASKALNWFQSSKQCICL